MDINTLEKTPENDQGPQGVMADLPKGVQVQSGTQESERAKAQTPKADPQRGRRGAQEMTTG